MYPIALFPLFCFVPFGLQALGEDGLRSGVVSYTQLSSFSPSFNGVCTIAKRTVGTNLILLLLQRFAQRAYAVSGERLVYRVDLVTAGSNTLLSGSLGHRVRNYKYTLKWLTDDGLQKLTQSHRETSSSSTDDDLDVCLLLEMGARWANKSLC